MRLPASAVLTDIEGTTTPISFVHQMLFPFARARLAGFIAQHAAVPEVAEAIRQTQDLAPGQPVAEALLGWMDQDAKITPLKTLQGLIWDEGYRSGALQGRLYPDVAPALRRLHSAGVRLYVYSSGSEAAQRQIFGSSDSGNLATLFSGFFDTRVGGKREAASYAAIARAVGLPAGEILFLSDVEAELDSAAESGMATCQLVRVEDGTRRSDRHPSRPDFNSLPV